MHAIVAHFTVDFHSRGFEVWYADIFLHVIDLYASVGDRSKVKVDFLQNERTDVLATDGDCLLNNIQVHLLLLLLLLLLLELSHYHSCK